MGETQWQAARTTAADLGILGVTQLRIKHTPSFRLVAKSIERDLKPRGVDVQLESVPDSANISGVATNAGAILSASPEALLSLSEFVSYHLFGRQPTLVEGDLAVLDLVGLSKNSPGLVFRDDWSGAKESIRLPEVFQDKFLDGSAEGPVMRVIPGGSFEMGSAAGEEFKDERPRHSVSIESFAVGQYEVTFDEYDVFARATNRSLPNDRGWGRGSRPVTSVSWEDAKAYAKWLSEKTGKAYRLPSESEWEYVSRAGTDTQYWWGEEIGEGKANCDGCGSEWDNKSTSPVGRFSANGFGLYDTLGNVWEWVEDCWHGNYEGAPVDGSAWLASNDGHCDQRVLRFPGFRVPGDIPMPPCTGQCPIPLPGYGRFPKGSVLP